MAAVPALRHSRSKLPLNSASPPITKGGNASVPVVSAVPWLSLLQFDMLRHGVDLPRSRFAIRNLKPSGLRRSTLPPYFNSDRDIPRGISRAPLAVFWGEAVLCRPGGGIM